MRDRDKDRERQRVSLPPTGSTLKCPLPAEARPDRSWGARLQFRQEPKEARAQLLELPLLLLKVCISREPEWEREPGLRALY